MQLGPRPGFGAYFSGTAPTPPSFIPSDLSDLALWLDASDTSTITQVAGSVSQWSDKSGNGRHATQGAGSRQPLTGSATMNARNVIAFDGSDDRMSLPSSLYSVPSGNNTILVVAQSTVSSDGATARRLFSGKVSSTTNYGLIPLPQTSNFSIRNGGQLNFSYTKDTNAHIWGMRRNGSALSSYLDGAASSNSSASNITLTELTIAQDTGGTSGQAFGGYIAEILLYTRALSDDEMNQIGAYFVGKWNTAWTDL